MPRPVHFEIHAEDPQRAIRFYSELFGGAYSRRGREPHWLIKTGDCGERGIDGGPAPRRGPALAAMAAVNACVCTVDVPALDTSAEISLRSTRIAAAEPVSALAGSLALPKMAVPSSGWLANGKDTESNLFGMPQPDPTAR